jgi:2-polyprenyl-6-methoxyphenol hydroxylase-like FAD-dependent oxidoreductase
MTRGEHAVVLGASLAGLASAAALAERFERVTIIERDTQPRSREYRDGVPQGRHVHILLPAGLLGLAELFPGIVDDLRARDARVMDTTSVRFYIAEGRLLLDGGDLEFVGATRPLLESVVCDRVRALPGVRLVEGHDARGLVASPDRSRVTGVRLGSRESNHEGTLMADLVVDATGRGSRSPRWLAALDYPPPEEERLEVGIHYTTRVFRREPGHLDGCQNLVVTIPHDGRRGGVALAVEADQWIVTLIGLGERPPADLDGFVEDAATLWMSDVHDLVAAASPLGNGSRGGFPGYLRRRYDRVRRLPNRYIVTGDAVCSLNPVYAQGMSVAIGETRTLGHILDQRGLDRVGPRFFQGTKRNLDQAWLMSTGADLGYPAVHGPRPAQWRLVNTYINRLLRVAHRDPIVALAFMEANGMVAPRHLMRPRIIRRVFTGGRRPGRTGDALTTGTARLVPGNEDEHGIGRPSIAPGAKPS